MHDSHIRKASGPLPQPSLCEALAGLLAVAMLVALCFAGLCALAVAA